MQVGNIIRQQPFLAFNMWTIRVFFRILKKGFKSDEKVEEYEEKQLKITAGFWRQR